MRKCEKRQKVRGIRGIYMGIPLFVSCRAMVAAIAICLAFGSQAAPEYTIRADNRIGNVTELTNTLATMETDGASLRLKLWLKPGVYDLRGVKMSSDSHLKIRHTRDAIIAGLGENPGDTILLGGGENDKCRVIDVVGGGNYWTTTISNLTITGGYSAGNGGGVRAGNSSVLYSNCIISNNYSNARSKDSESSIFGGGGCYLGRAYRCLFADNWTTGCGGGISTKNRDGANQTFQAADIVDCIFSNNHSTAECYSGGGWYFGGGAAQVPDRAMVSGCTFVGNTSVSRGGALNRSGNRSGIGPVVGCIFESNVSTNGGGGVSGNVAMTNCVFVENQVLAGSGGAISVSAISDGSAIVGCAFTNNTASKYGGALYVPGGVTNCIFVGNSSKEGGGAVYVHTQSNRDFSNCRFMKNKVTFWGHGGGIRSAAGVRAKVANSVFSGNTSSHGQAAYIADLYGCVITNHVSSSYVVFNCNMTGCVLGHNVLNENSAVFDYAESSVFCTNINCLIISNVHEAISHVAVNKANINCTYIGNRIGNGNYGDIIRYCPSFNCIFAGNKVGSSFIDIKTKYLGGGTYPLALTNCIFTASDMADDYQGLYKCRKVSDVKFADAANGDYTPTTRSAAYDAGCQEPWLLSLVGDKDLAGNPRVFGKRVDIGAYECQKLKPGVMLIFR